MNERGEITTNTKEIQTILKTYYEQLYANKLGNLEEVDAFLETHKLPKLEAEEIQNLNRSITRQQTFLRREIVLPSQKNNKIGKPLASLIKKKVEKTQINKITSERGEITTNTKEIQMI